MTPTMLFTWLTLFAFVTGGCERAQPINPDLGRAEVGMGLDATAHAIWHEHLRTIGEIVDGANVSPERFSDAVTFFEQLTGITVPFDHSLASDLYPTKETRSALEPLRSWYHANGHRLYWDEADRRVKVRAS